MTSPLRNARIAFTGTLGAITPKQALEVAREARATVTRSVSRLTSHLVIGMRGWPLLADGSVSLRLRRAEELNARGCAIAIISERRFLELAAVRACQPEVWKDYAAEDVCRSLNVAPATLELWERFGLVQAVQGRYDFQDLVSLQTIAELVQRGVRVESIAASLHHLSYTIAEVDRPLAQLRIVAEHSSSILADFGKYRLAPSGQLCFNFENPTECLEPVLSLPDAEATAAQWFAAGLSFEDEEQYEDAAKAYRKATVLDPTFADAFFNLGNVLRALGRATEAEEMYRLAIEQKKDMACAWYNLADAQEDVGQLNEAVESLRNALAISPQYADAHFNLAACLEKLGRPPEARKHWAAYLQLDPDSGWAEVARQHLERATAEPTPGC
jgi:tetratricopeptide (TPR) repeat protein